jgi:glycosyltransferase involved in cell wall biosynthesis
VSHTASPTSALQPLVSVIVTVYNQGWILEETLKSVAAQTYRPIECIIVDDGSTDTTPAVIASFVADCDERLSVQVIQQPNSGAQVARNAGLAASTGEFIQYLDGDDLLNPRKFALQIAFLTSSEGRSYDVVYGDARWLYHEHESTRIGEVIGLGRTDDFLSQALEGSCFNPLFSYLCRRSATEKAGAWDTEVLMNQDQHYFLSLACHGGAFAYLPGDTGSYRKHRQARVSDAGMTLRVRETLKILRSVEAMLNENRLELTENRRRALAAAYRKVSRWAFGRDNAVWRQALSSSLRLFPEGLPTDGARRLLQKSFGVWAGETISGAASLLKQRFSPGKQTA